MSRVIEGMNNDCGGEKGVGRLFRVFMHCVSKVDLGESNLSNVGRPGLVIRL